MFGKLLNKGKKEDKDQGKQAGKEKEKAAKAASPAKSAGSSKASPAKKPSSDSAKYAHAIPSNTHPHFASSLLPLFPLTQASLLPNAPCSCTAVPCLRSLSVHPCQVHKSLCKCSLASSSLPLFLVPGPLVAVPRRPQVHQREVPPAVTAPGPGLAQTPTLVSTAASTSAPMAAARSRWGASTTASRSLLPREQQHREEALLPQRWLPLQERKRALGPHGPLQQCHQPSPQAAQPQKPTPLPRPPALHPTPPRAQRKAPPSPPRSLSARCPSR